MEIQLASETLLLSEDKLISWPKEQTLFIADLHLGKTTHFRKSGIAIPTAIIKAEIDRLKKIILKFRPKRIFFLGDLFHSDLNHEWDLFNSFLLQYPEVAFILVKGNHDILQDNIYKLSQLQIKQEPFYLPPFILSHHPLEKQEMSGESINLCGHIHPGYSIKGKGRSQISLACYYAEDHNMILPAFGRFTGLAKIKAKTTSRIFVVLQESVREISVKTGR